MLLVSASRKRRDFQFLKLHSSFVVPEVDTTNVVSACLSTGVSLLAQEMVVCDEWKHNRIGPYSHSASLKAD
eukprot:1384187-Amphidinium_carterae.2